MNKKSFKNDNPALHFINQPNESNTPNTNDTHKNTENKFNTQEAHKTHDTNKTDNTQCTHDTQNTHIEKPINNERKETKSKRLNLLIQPSKSLQLNKIATMKRTSVNIIINDLIQKYVKKEELAIKKYDETFD